MLPVALKVIINIRDCIKVSSNQTVTQDAHYKPQHMWHLLRKRHRSISHILGRNEMDPPLCGSTAMRHNECQSSEPREPQEASPMQHEMHVLGIDIAKRVFHAVGMDNT